MAAIPVTITGVLADKYGRTLQNVTLFGEMSYTGLGIGGGPVVPPDKPPVDPDAHPEHPIVIPPPPDQPPMTPSDPKPPPSDGGWGWHPDYGWGYFPGPGEAQPKK